MRDSPRGQMAPSSADEWYPPLRRDSAFMSDIAVIIGMATNDPADFRYSIIHGPS